MTEVGVELVEGSVSSLGKAEGLWKKGTVTTGGLVSG